MTNYDATSYHPAAPLASLFLRTIDGSERSIGQVPALIDTGADVTLLPRWAVEQLGLTPQVSESMKLTSFDGSIHTADTVELVVNFQGGRFQGRYALVDQPHGILGRNLLNHFRLIFDGPALIWQRVTHS